MLIIPNRKKYLCIPNESLTHTYIFLSADSTEKLMIFPKYNFLKFRSMTELLNFSLNLYFFLFLYTVLEYVIMAEIVGNIVKHGSKLGKFCQFSILKQEHSLLISEIPI